MFFGHKCPNAELTADILGLQSLMDFLRIRHYLGQATDNSLATKQKRGSTRSRKPVQIIIELARYFGEGMWCCEIEISKSVNAARHMVHLPQRSDIALSALATPTLVAMRNNI